MLQPEQSRWNPHTVTPDTYNTINNGYATILILKRSMIIRILTLAMMVTLANSEWRLVLKQAQSSEFRHCRSRIRKISDIGSASRASSRTRRPVPNWSRGCRGPRTWMRFYGRAHAQRRCATLSVGRSLWRLPMSRELWAWSESRL